MAIKAFNFGSYGVADQLVPLQSAIGISGGTYVSSPSNGSATYPYAPPTMGGTSGVVSGASGGSAAGVTQMQADAVSQPLNPLRSPVPWIIIFLIVGLLGLHYIFYGKGK